MQGLERVAELPLTPPPPFAHSWVRGFGLVGDRPVPAVSLSPAQGFPTRGTAKVLLLHALASQEPFAVLVDDVHAIWSVNPEVFVGVQEPVWPVPAGWLTAAQHEAERIFCLSTEAMAEDLFGTAAPSAGDGA